MSETRIHIEGYGNGNSPGWDRHRIDLVVNYPGGQTRLTIGLEAPLPEGPEGDASLRQKLLALADAIQEVAGSDRAISGHTLRRN
jgi:hypothetical protein